MTDWDSLLLSKDFIANPYPVYHQLRSQAPICWSDAWGCWLLTRYSDVESTLRDYERFSSFGRVTAVIQQEVPEPLLEQIQPLVRHYSAGLINVDPPDHTRLRALVHKAFTPRVLERLKPRIQNIVDDYLDKVYPNGHMDLIRDLAFPLPATVIAELMGVPTEDRDQFKEWSDRIVEFQATPRPTPQVLLRSQQALLELREYFRGIYAQRRREPREDLISALVAIEEQGDKLSEEELLATCVSILLGGHETTTNLIGSGMVLLLKNPDQLRQLRDNPSLITSAVEEFLRCESPFQRNRRIATRDIEMEGRQIKKGQAVMQLLGAANRDPAEFADPDRLDITRWPNKHVAFGYGTHFCLGAGLARIEAPIAFSTILRRLPGLRLETETVEWHNSLFRGPKALPVSF